MVRFSEDAEVAEKIEYEKGEYLFKIYEVNEKMSKNNNEYWQVKFESKEGIKMCDNFMFFGKAATKTLGLLTALGIADGENFPDEDFEPDDILGKYLYIDTEKEKDSGFLKCPFDVKKYREYKSTKATSKPKPVKKDIDEDILPF